MNFKDKFNEYAGIAEAKIDSMFCADHSPESILRKSMCYSLSAGGKRLRPVLVLATADMIQGSVDKALPFACALEMIHTSSLIHDDLPEMDDDDFRRGLPSNHTMFGQGMAVLAGDSLLNMAYETISAAILEETELRDGMVRALGVIANATGYKGMMGGQAIDLVSEGTDIPLTVIERMYEMKTGALIKASVLVPAEIFGVPVAQRTALEKYSEKIGLAFQIRDDILDITGDARQMGKKPGSDENRDKSTFVKHVGIQQAKRILNDLSDGAVGDLGIFGGRAGFLIGLAEFLNERDH